MASGRVYDIADALHFDPGGDIVVSETQEIPSSFFDRTAALRDEQRHNPLVSSGDFEHLASIPVGAARLWRQLYGVDVDRMTNSELLRFLQSRDGHEKLITTPNR